MTRAWVLVLASIAAGCFAGGGATDAIGEPPPVGSTKASCEVDLDCVAAAATCCACPTFAIPATDPKAAVCDDVACDPMACPDNVEAACLAGACALVCKPLACDAACDDGYAIDAAGCLTCACAAPPDASAACATDADCVRTRADCCGCAGGGDDTAVAARDQAGFDASLRCPDAPQCPGVDTCDPSAAPRCVQGACALLPEPPAGACGRPELPACAPGEACTVNANDQASLYGLGVCLPR